jgi:hypothetical protein
VIIGTSGILIEFVTPNLKIFGGKVLGISHGRIPS